MFYDNYIKLCAKMGKSPSGVAKEIGLSNAAANGWKKGKLPNETTLYKLSNYFDVPVPELTGEDQKKPPAQGGELSQLDKRLNDLLLLASDDTKRLVIELLERLQTR